MSHKEWATGSREKELIRRLELERDALKAVEGTVNTLRSNRDWAIKAAIDAKLTNASIARAIGVSRSRIGQIAERIGK